MSDDVTSIPALDNTMGALLIGTLLAAALWGVGSLQMYQYFDRFPKDNWYIKLLVITVWLLDTAHQAALTSATYEYLVTHYADPTFLSVMAEGLWVMLLLSAFICFFVQLFLVYRVYRLSQRNIVLTAVLILFALGQFVSVILMTAMTVKRNDFNELPGVAAISRAINITGAVSDVAIASSLVMLLHRSRTGFKPTENIINRLIWFTIQTGLLTSLCMVFSLAFFCAWPNAFIYITFYVCVSRLYANTLYATLNFRKTSRGLPDATQSSQAISVSMARFAPRPVDVTAMGAGTRTTPNIAIKIDTETTHLDDQKMDASDSVSTRPESLIDTNSFERYKRSYA